MVTAMMRERMSSGRSGIARTVTTPPWLCPPKTYFWSGHCCAMVVMWSVRSLMPARGLERPQLAWIKISAAVLAKSEVRNTHGVVHWIPSCIRDKGGDVREDRVASGTVSLRPKGCCGLIEFLGSGIFDVSRWLRGCAGYITLVYLRFCIPLLGRVPKM